MIATAYITEITDEAVILLMRAEGEYENGEVDTVAHGAARFADVGQSTQPSASDQSPT